MFIIVQLHPQHKQKSAYRVQTFCMPTSPLSLLFSSFKTVHWNFQKNVLWGLIERLSDRGGGRCLAGLWSPEWELPNLSTFSPSFSLSFLLPVSQESDATQYNLAKSRTRSSKFVHLIPILLVAGGFQDKNLGQLVVYLWLPEYVKFSNGVLVSSWLCFKWYPISFGKFRTKTEHDSQVQTYLLQRRTYHRSFAKPNIYVIFSTWVKTVPANSQSIKASEMLVAPRISEYFLKFLN